MLDEEKVDHEEGDDDNVEEFEALLTAFNVNPPSINILRTVDSEISTLATSSARSLLKLVERGMW